MNKRDRRKMTHAEYMEWAEGELERIHNIKQRGLVVLIVMNFIVLMYGVWSILT